MNDCTLMDPFFLKSAVEQLIRYIIVTWAVFYTFLGSKTLYIIILKFKKFTIVNLGRV